MFRLVPAASRVVVVVGVLVFTSSGVASASSYLQTSGHVVDPILDRFNRPHEYSGGNLEPFANLDGVALDWADLINADLFNASLDYASLSYANLNFANLNYAGLTSADLNYAQLSGANLIGADLASVSLHSANLANADLSGAILTDANLNQASMFNANLTNADLSGATLYNLNLNEANLSGANLSHVDWLSLVGGLPYYDLSTDFTGTSFDPESSHWRLIPEPSTALLLGLGLVGLAARRRV